MDPGRPVPTAGLQKQHAMIGVFRKPSGQSCPRAAAANDHIIPGFRHGDPNSSAPPYAALGSGCASIKRGQVRNAVNCYNDIPF